MQVNEKGQIAIGELSKWEYALPQVSDGYHTFAELYEHRLVLTAALFNEWAVATVYVQYKGEVQKPRYNVHKSQRHHDGELCFGGGWFIVCAMLPTGQISYHYEMKYWDLFKIPAYETALFEFDGHTGNDVIERLKNYDHKTTNRHIA